jgi:nicotinamidase-related amidase
MKLQVLPLPDHYDPAALAWVWKVPYEQRAVEARIWAERHQLQPAAQDRLKLGLLLIDVQNTFCLPEFELFVGGRSGTGALDDNRRLVEFIYRNLGSLSSITATLDTHQALQIFHALFLVDRDGNHPAPYTQVAAEDVTSGRWQINPALAEQLGLGEKRAAAHLAHYTSQLKRSGKYALTIWPYHAMLGGIGHALVSAVEEAVFFHTIARYSQPDFILKGNHPLTEHYSAVGPEVLAGADGQAIASRSPRLLEKLRQLDALVIAGQAKSHCVAWTVADLLADIQASDPALAGKIYLLDDCTSPVVVPGADYSKSAEEAFASFAQAGMHRVLSTTPLADWPEFASAQPRQES